MCRLTPRLTHVLVPPNPCVPATCDAAGQENAGLSPPKKKTKKIGSHFKSKSRAVQQKEPAEIKTDELVDGKVVVLPPVRCP